MSLKFWIHFPPTQKEEEEEEQKIEKMYYDHNSKLQKLVEN